MKKMVIMVTVPIVLETWLRDQPKFLAQFYKLEIVTSSSENIKGIQEHEGVPIKIVDFNRKINIFKDLKVLFQLVVYLLKSRPDIVYTMTPKAGLLGMIASFVAMIPFRVHNVVGLPHVEAQGIRKKILIYSEKITYFFSTRLFCNSYNLIQEINKLTNKEVSVIGKGSVNGVNTALFKNTYTEQEKSAFKEKLSMQDDDFVITYVGRVVKDKGIDELVFVFEELQKRHENIKLLLVGDYEDELDSVAQSTKDKIIQNNNIMHVDYQEDVRPFLFISDLFVLPSYREGLPNVLIEAGSCGLPLVATNINGCNEVIEEEKNGLLVEKKDTQSLFEALNRLVEDKEFYQHIKNNVRSSIQKKYSQEYFYSELQKEFGKIGQDEK